MKPFKRPESVLVVVTTQTGKALCLLRSDEPLFWQSVTGSLAVGETPHQAAVRELYEETGLTVELGILTDYCYSTYFDIYPQWRHRYPEGTLVNLEHRFGFLLEDERVIQLSDEHIKYIWLPLEEAMKIFISPSNQDAIKALIK